MGDGADPGGGTHQLQAVAGADVGDLSSLGCQQHGDAVQRDPGGRLTDGTALASCPQGSEALGVPGPGHLCGPPLRGGRGEQPLQAGADQVGADHGEQAAGYHPLVPAAHRDSSCLRRPADREVAPVHPAVVPGAAGRPPLLPGRSGLALQPAQHETQAAETVLLGSRPLGDERWPGQPLPQLGATQAGGGPRSGRLAGREPLKQRVSGSPAGTSGQRSCDR
jgi:hypothetical protein